MDLVKIGKFINKQREEKGYTKASLAKKLGVEEKSVTEWEEGKKAPDVENLKPLAKALNVSVDEILSGKKMQGGSSSEKKTVIEVACGVAVVLTLFVLWIIMMMKFHIFANGASVKVDLISRVMLIAMVAVCAVIAWVVKGPHRQNWDE